MSGDGIRGGRGIYVPEMDAKLARKWKEMSSGDVGNSPGKTSKELKRTAHEERNRKLGDSKEGGQSQSGEELSAGKVSLRRGGKRYTILLDCGWNAVAVMWEM